MQWTITKSNVKLGHQPENAELKRQLVERDKKIEKLERRIVELEATLSKLNKIIFGKKSEKLSRPFKEIEKQNKISKTDEQKAKERARKKRQEREELRKQAATEVQIHHEIEEPKRRCPNCKDQELKSVGVKESILHEYVPAHFERQVHTQETWACPCCDHIATANGPQRPTEGGQYGAGFISHIAVSKCADSLPFYRMAKQFNRIGIPIARSTLCDLFHQAAQNLAILQSLIVTCDMHDVNSQVYLADVLIRIQTHPNKQIEDLLPHRWKELFAPKIPNSTFKGSLKKHPLPNVPLSRFW